MLIRDELYGKDEFLNFNKYYGMFFKSYSIIVIASLGYRFQVIKLTLALASALEECASFFVELSVNNISFFRLDVINKSLKRLTFIKILVIKNMVYTIYYILVLGSGYNL